MIFQKWGEGGGSKAVWNFSKNSFVLVGWPFPIYWTIHKWVQWHWQCKCEFVQSWCFDTKMIMILGTLSWRGLHEWHLRGWHGQESLDSLLWTLTRKSRLSRPGQGSLEEKRCSVLGGGIIFKIVCTIECWFRFLSCWVNKLCWTYICRAQAFVL